jgi:hypothetical protein
MDRPSYYKEYDRHGRMNGALTPMQPKRPCQFDMCEADFAFRDALSIAVARYSRHGSHLSSQRVGTVDHTRSSYSGVTYPSYLLADESEQINAIERL